MTDEDVDRIVDEFCADHPDLLRRAEEAWSDIGQLALNCRIAIAAKKKTIFLSWYVSGTTARWAEGADVEGGPPTIRRELKRLLSSAIERGNQRQLRDEKAGSQ